MSEAIKLRRSSQYAGARNSEVVDIAVNRRKDFGKKCSEVRAVIFWIGIRYW